MTEEVRIFQQHFGDLTNSNIGNQTLVMQNDNLLINRMRSQYWRVFFKV